MVVMKLPINVNNGSCWRKRNLDFALNQPHVLYTVYWLYHEWIMGCDGDLQGDTCPTACSYMFLCSDISCIRDVDIGCFQSLGLQDSINTKFLSDAYVLSAPNEPGTSQYFFVWAYHKNV